MLDSASRSSSPPALALAKTVDPTEQLSAAIVDALGRGRLQRVLVLASLNPEAQAICRTPQIQKLAEFVLLDRVSDGEGALVKEVAGLIVPALLESESFDKAVLNGVSTLLADQHYVSADRFVHGFKVKTSTFQAVVGLFEEALMNTLPARPELEGESAICSAVFSGESFTQAGMRLMRDYITSRRFAEFKQLLEDYPQFKAHCAELQPELERLILNNPLLTVPGALRERFDLKAFLEGAAFQDRLESVMRAELLRDNLDGIAVIIRNYPVSPEVKANLSREAQLVAGDLQAALQAREREQLGKVAQNPVLLQIYREYFNLDRELLAEVQKYFE